MPWVQRSNETKHWGEDHEAKAQRAEDGVCATCFGDKAKQEEHFLTDYGTVYGDETGEGIGENNHSDGEEDVADCVGNADAWGIQYWAYA
ncbi:MAG: hypothetical protein SAMD01599839_24100 [Rectinema sp.]